MKKDYIEDIKDAERRLFTSPVEVRARDGSEYFTGRAVVFNSRTDLGWFSEEIKAGAFSEVMKDDVRALFNHDPDVVLGRTKSGTMTVKVSDEGVDYEVKYNPADPDHVRVMEKVKRGDVSQSSFAFTVKEAKWETKEGKDHRVITKLERWYDVAPVTYPAYQDTSVGKRSLDSIKKEHESEVQKQNERAAKLRQIKMEIDLVTLGI